MVEYLYLSTCDGTLIDLTAVVASNLEEFQGFVIELNCYNGAGYLKLLNRNGVMHSTYPMHRHNGSALWHSRLGCAGKNVMDTMHKHVKGIDAPL